MGSEFLVAQADCRSVRRTVHSALVAILLLTGLLSGANTHADDKWQAQIPKTAEHPEEWQKLLPELIKTGMPYGALAGARDILNFFADLQSKELAFGTIIQLVDLGFPFSTRADFISGDIDPAGTNNFAQSYLLYKGIVNLDKKTDRWAENYFAKIDKENFPKYIFFRATEAYRNGKTAEAIQLLKKALSLTNSPESMSLAKKEARTLARIDYELGDFESSFEIYETFLLKTDPVTPTDWLEAAWDLYQLKRFPEALGDLYNLESKEGGNSVHLEKYELRALIYREFCSVAATDQLIKTFNADFGNIIDSIKLGEPLASFPQLVNIDLPQAQVYRQFTQTLIELESESKRIGTLPAKVQNLANYIYTTEIAMLKRSKQLYEDQALEALARHLVILGESLRFLKFDVARERFNPDRVFAEPPAEKTQLVDSGDDKNFRVHWVQWGDYWRDERLLYRGLLKTRCEL